METREVEIEEGNEFLLGIENIPEEGFEEDISSYRVSTPLHIVCVPSRFLSTHASHRYLQDVARTHA
ncbi:hypothetical protein Baya_7456 [Bagarius yarrelli]|uniref:Uncharacterized protein n=1 Tax=Bagarius yarrelli TaxID=175774 RepID=A0A556U150_BAGYA|nr:hypothetical protein Baya_7456 [Bagarius yarrelli]